MKDLTKIIGNLDLTKDSGGHELQNQVPPIVKTIVDSLFDQLSFVFPAWKHTWDSEEKIKGAKKEWVKAFFENDIVTKEQISNGLKRARSTGTDFLPSCGKFISWCKPSPEDIGWPSADEALKKCIEYRSNSKLFPNHYARPLVLELCKRVDWWLMNNANNQQDRKKVDKHFNDQYIGLLNSGYIEAEATNCKRLQTQDIVKAGMSEQQKEDKVQRDLERIRSIKAKFKRKNNNSNN